MRPLLILLLVLATTPTYGAKGNWLRPRQSVPSASMAGRICSNPGCAMCDRLHAAYVKQKAPEPLPAPVPPADEPAFVPTPQVVVDGMLAAVCPTPDDVLYDLGCGDGRILITAVREYGCRAVGIEVNPETADLARQRVREAGLEGRISIVTGDARKYHLDGASIVTLYLYVETMAELVPYIHKATRIVSYAHEIPGRPNTKVMIGDEPVYVWRKPPRFEQAASKAEKGP